MAEYTPSDDAIREYYAGHLQAKIAGATFGQGLAEFDRWLAAHDRGVAAKALTDAADELTPGDDKVDDWGIEAGMLRARAAALGVLPAEVEWEYGEFSKDDIQEDGSIHPWAEPLDTWDAPLTGDELSDLADVGSVCARRVKACPWVPVKGTEK